MKSSTQIVYREKIEKIPSKVHIARTSAKSKTKSPKISELSGLSWIILEKKEEYS